MTLVIAIAIAKKNRPNGNAMARVGLGNYSAKDKCYKQTHDCKNYYSH